MTMPSKKETTGTVEPAASETNEETTTIIPPLPTVLTAKEAADLIGVSRKRLYRLVAMGVVPGTKEGRSLQFDRDAVLRLRNLHVHRHAQREGLPEVVSCPFCSSPAYSYGIGADGVVGYGCRSGKCVWYQYRRAFGLQHEGQPTEFEQAMNVGPFLCIVVLNHGRKATVVTRTYDGTKVVDHDGPLALFEAIARVGGMPA